MAPGRRIPFAAGIVVFSLVFAGFWFMQEDPVQATPAGPVEVQAQSDGGALVLGLDTVSLGAASAQDNVEAIRWVPLEPPSDPVRLDPGPATIASGQVEDAAYSEVRLQFLWASRIVDGQLQDLEIPQNTLRVKVPGDAGSINDRLVITIDAERSIITREDGPAQFTPWVGAAAWDSDETEEGQDDTSSDPANTNTNTNTTSTAPPEQVRSEEPPGNVGGGSDTPLPDGDDDTDDQGTGDDEERPDVPMTSANIWVRDAAQAVSKLEVTITKLAFSVDGQNDTDAFTYFHGQRTVDLAQYRGPDDRALVAGLQFPSRDYAKLHVEFAATGQATIQGQDHSLVVPEARLVVHEPFDAPRDGVMHLLLDFSLDESLVLGADGWEFRPVIQQYQTSLTDIDGDDTSDALDPDDDNDGIPDNQDKDRDDDKRPDAKPQQYRIGGPPLPSIGTENKNRIQLLTGIDFDARSKTLMRLVGLHDEGKGSRPATAPVDDANRKAQKTEPDIGSLPADPTEVSKKGSVSVPTNLRFPEVEDTTQFLPGTGAADGRVQLIVESTEESFQEFLALVPALDGKVLGKLHTQPIALIELPEEDAATLRELPGFTASTPQRDVPLLLDVARTATGAETVASDGQRQRLTTTSGQTLDGTGIGIAVIDSGIDGTHPDLAYRDVVARNLKFFPSGYTEARDTDTTSGHGTHVAGAAAGRGAILGSHEGMAPGATVYGLGTGDGFTLFFTLQAMDWVLQHHDQVSPPIRVVANAWGSAAGPHDPLSLNARLTDALVAEGITVVYAAGNGGGDGGQDRTTPESKHPTPGVIGVGAYSDETGITWIHSSRGKSADPGTWPDLVAPGHKVTAPLALSGAMATTGVLYESPDVAYATLSGSSMATGITAGAVALLLQADPSLTPAEVEALLTGTASGYAGSGGHAHGSGLLRVDAAVAGLG